MRTAGTLPKVATGFPMSDTYEPCTWSWTWKDEITGIEIVGGYGFSFIVGGYGFSFFKGEWSSWQTENIPADIRAEVEALWSRKIVLEKGQDD